MASNPYGINYSWSNVVATLGLAVLLWGVPFVVWPHAEGKQVREPGRAPMKIKFLGAVQGVDGSAWSPVVFPLPTKYGFSDRVDTAGGRSDMAQVFQPAVVEGVYADLPVTVTPPADVGMLVGGQGEESFRPAAVGEEVFSAGVSGEADLWRMEMDSVLLERQFVVASLKNMLPEATGRGSVEAYVELDRSGAPLHVLLDHSSGNTNFDRAVVRALYLGRGQRFEDGGAGRVRLFYRRGGDAEAERNVP
jgi:hypothetical protein